MRKKCMPIIVLLLGLLWCNDGLCASNRVALVIGNKDYQDRPLTPLTNPVNDANDLSKALGRLGFDVIKKTNLTHREMEDAITEFGQKIKDDGVALFYFSGHGAQVKGTNYLLPLGEKILGKSDIKHKSVSAEFVLDKMNEAGSKIQILILDACRNNPAKGTKGGSQGLATMNPPAGVLIAYATAADSEADDNLGGRNSLYTKYLLKQLEIPGVTIESVFTEVKYKVADKTGGTQVPFVVSGLHGERFYFIPPTSTNPPTNPPQGNLNPGTARKTRIGKYINNGDGTITDTKTGLMWKRCSEGLSGKNCEKGKAKEYKWAEAMQRFKEVSYAGYDDWRMPTIDELKTLVYCSKGVKNKKSGSCNNGSTKPTIAQQVFPGNTKWLWSRSPFTGNSDSAWFVNFLNGDSGAPHRSNGFAVQLVRSGQSPKNSPQENPDHEKPINPGMDEKPKTEKKRIGKYIDNGNGTITDTETGLMWKRCSEGLSGKDCKKGLRARGYTWNDAVQRFKNVEYADHADWRLPTIDELKTLVYCSNGVKDKDSRETNKDSEDPAINQQAIPKTRMRQGYWSRSPDAAYA